MPPAPSDRRATARVTARWAPLLLALAVGCRTWVHEPLRVAGAPTWAVRGHVRATRTDGTRVELTQVRIAGDTLRGALRTAGEGQGQPVAIPVDSVRDLERRRFSIGRTVGLYFGVMGAFFFLSHAVGSETGASR
jgi:hypothetical protein